MSDFLGTNLKDIVVIAISFLALMVSVVSIFLTRKTAKEQLKQQKFTAELAEKQLENLKRDEEKKQHPNLNVTIQKFGKNNCFYITNKDGAEIYNLNLELVNSPDNPLYDANHKLPLSVFKKDAVLRLGAAFSFGSPSIYEVKLIWENKMGDKFEEVFHLSW